MRFSPILIAVILLASTERVLGGSRFWESKAPNKRTDLTPSYQALETFNSTSPLVKRAMSLKNLPGDKGANKLWPNKRIRYCFDDVNLDATYRGLWDSAMEVWAELKKHGFSYKEVSREECTSQLSSVLRIHFNDRGRLASTVGIPVIDEAENARDPDRAVWEPYTHLSALETVGQENLIANMAHGLGHVWSLHHEHQIPHYWEVSVEDTFRPWNFQRTDEPKRFLTSNFNCKALTDYGEVEKRFTREIDAANKAGDKDLLDELTDDQQRLCFSRDVAQKHNFSASEWLPWSNTVQMVIDKGFDPESIMLYPSRSGGKVTNGVRAVVLTYLDGSEIPSRVRPSSRDIERLVMLYGDPAPSTLEVPHVSKSSQWRNNFRELRKKISFRRAGDTKDGTCSG